LNGLALGDDFGRNSELSDGRQHDRLGKNRERNSP
jgi:hypothetical protein